MKLKTQSNLDAELEQLLKVVEQQDRDEQEAKKLAAKSRALGWRTAARAYLWWRDANQQQGYLDALYAQHNIPNNQLGNRINFNPLVRRIWDIHGKSVQGGDKAGHWNGGVVLSVAA